MRIVIIFIFLCHISAVRSQRTLSRSDSAMYFGVKFYKSKDIVNAIAKLDECIALSPQNDECLFYRGQIAFESGDFDLGKRIFKVVLSLQERDAQSWDRLGLCYQQLKQYDSAELCFKNAVLLNSKQASFYANWGRNEYLRGNKEHAEQLYSTAILIDSKSSEYYSNRASIRSELGRKEDAVSDLNDAIKINPQDKAIQAKLDTLKPSFFSHYVLIFGGIFALVFIVLGYRRYRSKD